tara:strand:- start:323 stop:940 length:618 start_codon:yes stop_codon:yes gene_type:complete
MPYIKDKYKGKGDSIRSKYIIRKDNSAIQERAPEGISNQQRDQIFAENFRSVSSESASVQTTQSSVQQTNITTPQRATIISKSNLKGFEITAANTILRICVLAKGDTLKNIIIHNKNATSCTINIYWSPGDQSLATFNVSSGAVTSFAGISLTNLFGDSFTSNATISLKDLIDTTYENVGSDIVFYAVASAVGPNLTVSTSRATD